MRIWIATGGTGGHVFPALAVAAELAARGHRLTISTDGRMRELVKTEIERLKAVDSPLTTHHSPLTIHLAHVWASGVGAKSKLKQAVALFEIMLSVVALILRFMLFRPDRVVGFGGYSSVPAVLAARVWKIPTFSHEQNAAIGRAQKFTLRWVDVLMTSFQNVSGVPASRKKSAAAPKFAGATPTSKELKIVYTGLPVRKEFIGPALETRKDADFRLLITGGSLGATILDDRVPLGVATLAAAVKKKLFVVHQTRPENVDRLTAVYLKMGVRANVLSFIRDMAGEMRAADLVIGRSGASTVVELQTIGKPAILVPLAINPDQAANAAAFAKNGGGFDVPGDKFTAKWLGATISELFENPARLKSMATKAKVPNNAVKNIVDVVLGK